MCLERPQGEGTWAGVRPERSAQRNSPAGALRFMPEVDASKIFKRWYGTKESRMVAGYDPETEVVICFIRKADDDKTDIDAYKIKTRPAPPLAAERED
jgi:hypothetical protein